MGKFNPIWRENQIFKLNKQLNRKPKLRVRNKTKHMKKATTAWFKLRQAATKRCSHKFPMNSFFGSNNFLFRYLIWKYSTELFLFAVLHFQIKRNTRFMKNQIRIWLMQTKKKNHATWIEWSYFDEHFSSREYF